MANRAEYSCDRQKVFGGNVYDTGTVLVAWNDTTLRRCRFTSSELLKDWTNIKKGSLIFVVSCMSGQQRREGMSFWSELYVITGQHGCGWMTDIYLDLYEPNDFNGVQHTAP